MNGLELRDIHLPDASLWWPLAPGWWLLLLLLVLVCALPWGYRWYRQGSLRRLSLAELERIRNGGQDRQTLLRDISVLLRRTLIAFNGRRGYAGSTGEDWVVQLQQLSSARGFSETHLQLLSRGRYQRDSDYDPDSLLQACEDWLRSLPRSKPHAAA